jgi:uridine kinase
MTNPLERDRNVVNVTITGGVNSGKTTVTALIAKALKESLPTSIITYSRDGDLEKAIDDINDLESKDRRCNSISEIIMLVDANQKSEEYPHILSGFSV